MKEILLGDIKNFEKHKGYTFNLEGRDIFVYFLKNSILAIDNCCSHEKYPLDDGLIDEEKKVVTCIHHGAKFDLLTGKALSLPAFNSINIYKIIKKENLLYIRI